MNVIVSVDQNWGIGNKGDQPFYISTDQKRLKALTMGHPVILGRKTLATFPYGRPLWGRRNLILSRDTNFTVEGAEVYHDLDALLAAAPGDSVVIGGGSVYRALLGKCETVYVTKVMAAFEADTFFLNLDADPAWQLESASHALEENGLQFQYLIYGRR